VLAGLAPTLGLDYQVLMSSAGYGESPEAPASPSVTSRFANAHIVELLEKLVDDVAQLRDELHAALG